MSNSRFLRNRAASDAALGRSGGHFGGPAGGAVAVLSGTLDSRANKYAGNHAAVGGAVAAVAGPGPGHDAAVVSAGDVFAANAASSAGGAVFAASGAAGSAASAPVALDGATFSANAAARGGAVAALSLGAPSSLSVRGSSFAGNTALEPGPRNAPGGAAVFVLVQGGGTVALDVGDNAFGSGQDVSVTTDE